MSTPVKKRLIDTKVIRRLIEEDTADSPKRPRPLDVCRRIVDTSDPRSPLTPLSPNSIMKRKTDMASQLDEFNENLRKANQRVYLRTHDAPPPSAF
tara:strand:+ start:615 stop:902 length:288 start_codon:yes stop_codon:yes gene_type:complete